MKLRSDNWDKVKFEEFVSHISERVEPGNTDLDKYIGLEHLDTGKIRINRFGSPDEVIGTKLKIYRGDIIFGKRRAYQRKAAITDFDAICSAHAMVLRANESKVDKSYLLTFIHSDLFMTRAIEISEGSLSPTIKWKILAGQKFPLPPIAEQKQIAALFKSIEAAIEQTEVQERSLHFLLQNLINESLHEESKIRKTRLQKVIFGTIALNVSERVEPKNAMGQVFVGLDHIDSREIRIERSGKPDDLIGTKLRVYEGDIIFGKRNAYLRKAAVSTFNGICSAHAMVIRANEKNIQRDYLPFFMHADIFMLRAKEISEGSISPTIKWKNLERQEFSIPDLEQQKKLTEVFQKIEAIRLQLKQQKIALKNLKQKLLNEILG